MRRIRSQSIVYRSPTVTSTALHYPSGTHDIFAEKNISFNPARERGSISYQPAGGQHVERVGSTRTFQGSHSGSHSQAVLRFSEIDDE